MPVSGRPTKAALLKITQGSSTPEVNGRQNAASGPAVRVVPGAAIAGSGGFRFNSKLPKTINEVMKPASNRMKATRQRAGTVSTTTLGGGASREGTA